MPEARRWYQKPRMIVLTMVLALVGAWIIYFVWQVGHSFQLIQHGQDPLEIARQKQFQASVANTVAKTNVTADDLTRIEASDEPVLGNPNAKVHIVEFVDYQCPYSRQVSTVIRSFMQQHAQDATLEVRDFPIVDLHPDAERSSIAARCVYNQGNMDRFWRYYDRLFASQDAQSPDDLRTYAEQVGADLAAYDACVAAKEPHDHIVKSVQDGMAAGVGGTPTFFLNGIKIQGAMDANTLETVFTEIAKRAN